VHTATRLASYVELLGGKEKPYDVQQQTCTGRAWGQTRIFAGDYGAATWKSTAYPWTYPVLL
jgi:hypothetical protein